MSLFDTFIQREKQEREKQARFTGYLKQKVNEYIEQGMSVDDAMKAAYSNENVLKEAEKAGKEIVMFKETNSNPNFDYKEIERLHLETDDKPTATRIFNAEIHWKQPIDIYITRPEANDPNFVAKIYATGSGTFVDSFDDAEQELGVDEIYQQSIERITLCQGSMNNPMPLIQCFDNVCEVEYFLNLDEVRKKQFLSAIYHQAWLEIRSNLMRLIYDRGLNPDNYIEGIAKMFDNNEFPSIIELREVVITSSMYGGGEWYPTNRKITYNPILDVFSGDIKE